MKTSFFTLPALLLTLVAGCATSTPKANDWTSEYLGKGRVPTTVKNKTKRDVFLKVRSGDRTVAQTAMSGRSEAKVLLDPGTYFTEVKIAQRTRTDYFQGPEFEIPPTVPWMTLTLRASKKVNLTPIDSADFGQ